MYVCMYADGYIHEAQASIPRRCLASSGHEFLEIQELFRDSVEASSAPYRKQTKNGRHNPETTSVVVPLQRWPQ